MAKSLGSQRVSKRICQLERALAQNAFGIKGKITAGAGLDVIMVQVAVKRANILLIGQQILGQLSGSAHGRPNAVRAVGGKLGIQQCAEPAGQRIKAWDIFDRCLMQTQSCFKQPL